MTRKSTVICAAIFAAVAAAGLSGCGEADQPPQSAREPTLEELEAVWQQAEPIIEDELAKEDARSALRFPCTLFDKQAAGTLLGTSVEAPAFANEFQNLQNADTGESSSWQAEACSWNNWGDGASMNVWVSQRAHFPDNTVKCHGIHAEDITESLFNGTAKWEFLDSFGWAKLLVCTDDALFFVEIHDGPVNEAEAKDLATAVAKRIIADLP